MEAKKGILYAILIYVIWGVMPIYWQALNPIDSMVIIFYRIVLVAIVCFFAALKTDGWEAMREAIRPKEIKLRFILAGIFITVNWSLYVWAVKAHFVIQTSIGHYIEPLLIALFGVLLFREKMTKSKLAAFLFAAAGICVMVFAYGEVPILAIALGATFAVYAAIKKNMHCPSMVSLFYETIFLAPFALAIVIYLEVTGQGALGVASMPKYLLLMTVGAVTVVVLWLFAEAEKKTSLSNIGFIAYISPSISLFLGIFVLGEDFDIIQLLGFAVIWVGLVIFAVGSARTS